MHAQCAAHEQEGAQDDKTTTGLGPNAKESVHSENGAKNSGAGVVGDVVNQRRRQNHGWKSAEVAGQAVERGMETGTGPMSQLQPS